MPYVFRIHKQRGNAPHPATFTEGWGESVYLTDSLLGEIVTGQTVGRMGTSIPSIFARPILFQTAFNTITPAEYNGNGLNQKIVSEALDMLEFLSQNARSSKLITEDWVPDAQLAYLRQLPNLAMHRLADAIDAHLEKIGNPDKITLFFWKDYNNMGNQETVLIGGTSYSTLVFTSPNWSRKLKANGWKFTRTDGSKFFDGDIKSLQKRNEEFRNMMFNLRLTFNNEFNAQCNGNHGLCRYIWETMQIMHVNIPTMPPANFMSDYPAVKGVYAGTIPLPCKTVNVTASGYAMRPSSTRYSHKIAAGGAAVNVPVPLALNDAGLPGVRYVGQSFWLPTYTINDAHVRTTPDLTQRELPGEMGIKYPYVTASDFLEDTIIKVRGSIDSAKFHTLFNGQSQYLLPLKKEFFDFFEIKDLEGNYPGINRPLVEITPEGGTGVKVTINVPIIDASHHFIPLSKTYSQDAIVTPSKPVEIGFFPFYRVNNNPHLDIYSVMLSSDRGANLDFYKIDPAQVERIPSDGMQRTESTTYLDATKHYEVKSSIDLVEVILPDGKKGMVIPKMTVIQMGTINFRFAIDFGTSNTFIAYAQGDKISTLDFGLQNNGVNISDDTQTVYLYSPENVPMMIDTYQREFMLPTIGKEDSLAKFPIKTSVCEVAQFENQGGMKLFGNINIGFKFQNEIAAQNIPNAKYYTKLKWALEQDPGNKIAGERVLAFCKQILWLLKNKALLNGGSANFTVMLTFPESMIDRSVFYQRAPLSGIWVDAANELGLNSTNMFDDTVTESEAPYYMVVKGADNMLNVDIGGGTTDMFLVKRNGADGNILKQMESYYSSVKFAADDLWGDGAGARRNTTGNNGFCKYLTQKIRENNDDISGITRLVDRSADVMAALFSNEKRFKTSVLIRQNNVLKSVLLLHYTALLFAISRFLKKREVGIPGILSFTGMGSMYLSLISSQEMPLQNFTKRVLEMLMGTKAPANFKVQTHFENAKKVTAEGALAKDTAVLAAYHIPNDTKHSFTDLGADSYPALTYGDLLSGQQINDIREDARKVFDQYIKLLRDAEFGRLTGEKFETSIPEILIEELENTADQSFNNVKGGVSATYAQRPVTDNLFFWFLKDSLCRLSLKYDTNPSANSAGVNNG